MLKSEKSLLFCINPLLKIIFILFQSILILFFLNLQIGISILIILNLIIVTDIKIIPAIFTTILRFSPLLLSIFLLGYIFGNSWQKDVYLLGVLVTFLIFSFVLLKTTSAYSFFSQIKAVCGNKCHNLIIFLYGIVRFMPIIFHEYTHTLTFYRTRVNQHLRLSSFVELFPLIANRALLRVRQVHHSIDNLISRPEHLRFGKYDLLIPLLLIVQTLLVFI